ncbi:DUF2914 domain-containing protein [Acidovorax sp. SUPP2539]|uniref:DUF2914 domain-containing protein n=1 Tax=Acidovorax sp. SUPP2539 TaxID=2920878 RepID=UPI0024E0F172|nr:DUF2914 domain-containing protein [Acidovorax sp. SUPP2539]
MNSSVCVDTLGSGDSLSLSRRGRAIRQLFFALVLGSGLGFAGLTFSQDLRVERGVWTSGVQNRQYTKELRSDTGVSELYFWTLLKGGPDTLSSLKEQGKLPIIHQWSFSSPLSIAPDVMAPTQEDSQDIGKLLEVGAIVDNGGLTATVNEGRDFRWRTWSHKQSLWRGRWIVRVLYADGEPVPCDKKPCQWSFVVR